MKSELGKLWKETVVMYVRYCHVSGGVTDVTAVDSFVSFEPRLSPYGTVVAVLQIGRSLVRS